MKIDNSIVNFDYSGDKKKVFPAHPYVSNWQFDENEINEATLAHFMAVVAEKNGLSNNEISHVFPIVLRILKSDIPWSK